MCSQLCSVVMLFSWLQGKSASTDTPLFVVVVVIVIMLFAVVVSLLLSKCFFANRFNHLLLLFCSLDKGDR